MHIKYTDLHRLDEDTVEADAEGSTDGIPANAELVDQNETYIVSGLRVHD